MCTHGPSHWPPAAGLECRSAWKARRPASSTREEQGVTDGRDTYSTAGTHTVQHKTPQHIPVLPAWPSFWLTPAPAPCHPRGAVASKTNSRLVPYRLKYLNAVLPSPLAFRGCACQKATRKEWCPQKSSLRTWGYWAVPILEIPPASPDTSGCLPSSPLSHVRGCYSAHVSLLPLSAHQHPSWARTPIPL